LSIQNWILLFILSLLWGASFVYIELALLAFDPLQIAFLRVSIAALALCIYLMGRGLRLAKDFKSWRFYFLMGIFNNAIPFSLMAYGQTYIMGNVASILNSTTPIFALILAHYTTADERFTWRKAIAVIVGFTGIAVMFAPSFKTMFSGEHGSFLWLGQLAIIGAAFCYALSGIIGKNLKEHRAESNACAMLLSSSAILAFILLVLGDFPTIAILKSAEGVSVGSVFALAILSTALAYILYFTVLQSAGATNLMLVTFLIPASAIGFGYIFLNEALTIYNIAGFALILMSLSIIDGRIMRLFKKHSYQ
jgi:drug/metabolite transporter (DMT)-like permease